MGRNNKIKRYGPQVRGASVVEDRRAKNERSVYVVTIRPWRLWEPELNARGVPGPSLRAPKPFSARLPGGLAAVAESIICNGQHGLLSSSTSHLTPQLPPNPNPQQSATSQATPPLRSRHLRGSPTINQPCRSPWRSFCSFCTASRRRCQRTGPLRRPRAGGATRYASRGFGSPC